MFDRRVYVTGVARKEGRAVRLEMVPWQIEADPAAPRRVHAQMRSGSPEQCGCLDCRNFAAARSVAYRPSALALFQRLGIRSDRESEICGPACLSPSRYHYTGWFHFVGSVLDGPGSEGDGRGAPPVGSIVELRYRPLESHFSFLLRPRRDLLPREFGDQAVVQLEFSTEVPWLLAERPQS